MRRLLSPAWPGCAGSVMRRVLDRRCSRSSWHISMLHAVVLVLVLVVVLPHTAATAAQVVVAAAAKMGRSVSRHAQPVQQHIPIPTAAVAATLLAKL
eukprot:COSAG05_NODE_4899_length_1333_cov_0.960292_2_plen_96_part_01